ncbi:23S rRNA m(2)A-2503 methyltransferase [Thalassoporum mexicanum PCC 7367]|uniref:23S rRNA (adenine(2503)-C(2))-methyltransferase RlmN n=1 Tax=Thalassoporum mexicanum TaxID=3457544 RepID=UPI00029FBC2D|nr:23S rRNA (adenine(2503)-C(2))-methyltransferase RlmN [Pseudanabaena sp. PCC 7367]AFY70633.1 23S rRNA m(2)A-2503 methyltransferase [Pseudanabaena sp. PCC 7367]
MTNTTAAKPAKPLLGRSQTELTDWIMAQGQPKYRGKQLHNWLYHKGIHNLQEITVFPKTWRQEMAETVVGRSQIHHQVQTKDKTLKLLLELSDGAIVETVGIPTSKRLTVCVSSQVGCPMGCHFCATGKGGYDRNLEIHEIVDQVLTVQEQMERRVSHLVFMGMGEPLLNVENLVGAIKLLNQDIGIGQRNITVSTVGVRDRIPQLAQHHLQATLAVSLHAPTQELRHELIPSAQTYPIEDLLADCRDYVEITGRRISFEYTLLAGVNDSPQQAQQLAKLIRGFQSHVNLIPYNPIADADFKRPRPEAVQTFLDMLISMNVAASVRHTRGIEADAACGQLRGTHEKLAKASDRT